ncbi:MAG: P-loop NTPase, partial [Cyclobacteriaceae bacterium]
GGKKLAEKHTVPFLGEIPLVQSIREAGDNGTPAILQDDNVISDSFQELAASLAQQVAIRNATVEETKKVELNT